MKVILTKDLKGSGKAGDLVDVKDGFAKNFLLPKGLAKVADNMGLNEIKTKNDALLYKKKKEEEDAKNLAKKLDGVTILITAKAGENGKLFGSVTSKEIAEKINSDFNIVLEKRKILVPEDIKAFGTYECELKLFKGIKAKIKVRVTEA